MKDKVIQWIWKGIPTKSVSRIMGYVAKRPFSRRLIPYYVKHFDVDLTPVKKPLHEFETLLDFFVRELATEARPIDVRADHVIQPVDGTISQIGVIENNMLLQAKGVSYSLSELLGEQTEYVNKYKNGKFITIYLSPKDYHRIHMPFDGKIVAATYIPGTLYPVNEFGLRLFPGLFAKNERLITYIETNFGEIAMVKVGATNVGSIKVTYDDEWVTNKRKTKAKHKRYVEPIPLQKGEELGRFEFGSTVILLFEPNTIHWLHDPKVGNKVQMGQPLAKVINRKKD